MDWKFSPNRPMCSPIDMHVFSGRAFEFCTPLINTSQKWMSKKIKIDYLNPAPPFPNPNTSLRLITTTTPMMTPPSQAYSFHNDTSFTHDDNELVLYYANPCALLTTSYYYLPSPSFAHRHWRKAPLHVIIYGFGWVSGMWRDIYCGTRIPKRSF